LGLVASLPPSVITSLPAAAEERAFADFDERLVAGRPGLVVARAPSSTHAALARHAARRLRASGSVAVEAWARDGAPSFRDAGLKLGVSEQASDPIAYAEALAAAADERAAILTAVPREGTWDAAVAAELSRSRRLLLVMFTEGEATELVDTFHLGAELAPADKARWLAAIADEAHGDLPTNELRALEAWWAHARHARPEAQSSPRTLSPRASELLTFLVLAGRSLPWPAVAARDPSRCEEAAVELASAGWVVRNTQVIAASSTHDCAPLAAVADPAARVTTAEQLDGGLPGFEPDPWARARAAELFVEAGAFDRADAAIERALRSGVHPRATAEIGARWFSVVAPIGGAGGLRLRVSAAKRALALGAAIDAQRWCESAAAIDPEDPSIHLLMARALTLVGDLVAARVCLSKAEAAAERGHPEVDLAARVAAERAEVCYLAGELEDASAHAERAVSVSTTPATRLAARGTIGKLLLARGAWELADRHFAEDAISASSLGDATAELRARLNRAIALLSKGMLDEARALLLRVLEDGTRLHEERARAYALSNLGLVAYRQRDYGSALHYWEQTARLPEALRGRLATALTIGNLAELRLRLGLVDHAEHAIAFGRQMLGTSAPPRCTALFKWVSAQIALARRKTELARREIESAVADAQASGDRTYLESACVVAARVALEDGDLARSTAALARAADAAKSPRSRAEVAIVRAAHLRALGQPALESAGEALQVARASGDDDLLFEIHALLALLHRDAGDLAAAQAHCCLAGAVRDNVVAGLPSDLRAAYLAKPDVVAMSQLQATLQDTAVPPSSVGGVRGRNVAREEDLADARALRREGTGVREIVGDDPQMKSLERAIRKVARSSSTVLIRGESGTGKELVAEALHRGSERASGPLVSVNCAALVETLLLSELFGHEKGAFTGASSRRRGRFELAEGGTLFLDEIGDVSPRTQVALLRVLQEKTFERVGGTTPIRANVRVVCATHRDLRAMVDRGEFREDLYYRLRGITLEVPPLRARIGDLPKIAGHLLDRIATERGERPKRLSPSALELLGRHRWPGNVRELENVLRGVVLFAEGEMIETADLVDNVDELRSVARVGRAGSQPPLSHRPGAARSVRDAEGAQDDGDFEVESAPRPAIDDGGSPTTAAYSHVRQGAVSLSDMKRRIERDCIAMALAETKGNITRAAALLGMKRPRLSQLVKQYGLSASSEGSA
jgi:transcriptional regulator with GAF, ATPase, and Fis domain/tetratricopeptide (TPR) repeat protein